MELYFMYVTDPINLFLSMSCGKISCLAYIMITHTTLHEQHYFTNFIPKNAPLTTLWSSSNLIDGYENADLMLSNGTKLTLKETFYSLYYERTLLSFKDIRENKDHIETIEELFWISL